MDYIVANKIRLIFNYLSENIAIPAAKKVIIFVYDHRNMKIFKLMSDFIGSRDGIQCRSHHIKQMRTHRQIKRIIQCYDYDQARIRVEIHER